MSTFDERKRSFEKKFINDQEIQFKVSARRNKYIGEWVSEKLGKNEIGKKEYIQEVIKADFEEPGDEDVFKKIKNDFKNAGVNINDSEIRKQMILELERAKKDFL